MTIVRISGNTGTKVGGPIVSPWLSLVDLGAGDAAVWVGRGAADGTFDISGVPDGNYTLTWWDEPQDYNLNMVNVTVSDGETVTMGQLPLNGWWTEYDGYVFADANRNGVKDSGESGVPNFTLTLRHRENNLYDRGQATETTPRAPTASIPATAASSARSATTQPATSSTRSMPPPRTGSRASRACLSSCMPRLTAARTRARRATQTTSTSSPPMVPTPRAYC